eukprot:12794845-Prorocentrum_lima.AAC.1
MKAHDKRRYQQPHVPSSSTRRAAQANQRNDRGKGERQQRMPRRTWLSRQCRSSQSTRAESDGCLLYTSDAADDM